MTTTYKEGDHVFYHPIGGSQGYLTESTGIIKKVITASEEMQHGTMKASESEPRFIIENDNTHKEAAYKQSNITGIAE